MSGIKFSNTTPAAPGGKTLVTFQADGLGNVSAWYTPGGGGGSSGGVNLQTINYTIVSGDAGKIVVMNGASLTVKLPAASPSTTWSVFVANISATNLTLDPNGLTLDGSASTVLISPGQGFYISTDGTNYFSTRGTIQTLPEVAAPATPSAGTLDIYADSTDHRFHDKNPSGVIGTTVVADTGAAHDFLTAISPAGVISKAQPSFSDLAVATGDVSFSTAAADKITDVHDPTNPQDVATKAYVDAQFTSGNMVAGVNNQTGTTYTIVNTDRAKLITFSNSAAIAVTLPQAGSGGSFSNTWFVWVENRGVGMVTITPTTSTIDGGTSITLATGCGIGIFSDGTNYFLEQGNVAALQTVATGSNSYTANQTQNFSLIMPKASLMFQVTEATGKKFRLRLYSTSAARTSDASRPYSVPIVLGQQNKLILDLFIDQSSVVTPFFLSPAILGVNGDGTPATTIYAAVTSFESTTQNINVTVSYVSLGN